MKFVFGVAVGYWLFHPLDENNKFDRATLKLVRNGGKKITDFVAKRVEKVFGP